ncbi:condensation domain-containing protein, partial [Streptomyces sp. NPDC006314]|uniref:condensation domain-containing protein n=1 Tax=Streptomyces sp. NPDC006314 TaxID=3154475 RepID=UPI0033BB54A4
MNDFSIEQLELIQQRLREAAVDGVEEQRIPCRATLESNRAHASFAQRRLWFVDQLQPESPAYNADYLWRLRGEFDIAAFTCALNELRRRHEILRTHFENVAGEPVQVIAEPTPLDVPVVDWSGKDETAAEKEAVAWSRRVAVEPFDLTRGPLLRVRIIRLAPDCHLLMLVVHHIIVDGWSMDVFWRELGALYEAARDGSGPALDALPIQYSDYAEWQESWMTSDAAQQQLTYWKDQLRGAPEAMDLPTDRVRPTVLSGRGERVDFSVPPATLTALRTLAEANDASLFMVLLAAWDVFLARCTGTSDIITGTPVAGRTSGDLEGLMGLFVNQLPLRVKWDGDPTFTEMVRLVRDVALGGYANQDIPFERVVEAVAPERRASMNPIFQIAFDGGREDQNPRLPGLDLETVSAEASSTGFDLEMRLAVEGDTLAGSLRYSPDLFERRTVDRFIAQYCRILRSAASNAESRVSEFVLVDGVELERVLVEWNATDVGGGGELVSSLFEGAVAGCGADVAVVDASAGVELSYAEFGGRVFRLARYLRGLGVGPER